MHLIKYKPIGVIRSPFKELKGMPIQPVGASGVKGRSISKRSILRDLRI